MTPRDARDRYLSRRNADSTDRSVDSWFYRLKLFCEWCQGVGIETVGDLRRLDMDDYYHVRSAEIAPTTLKNEMSTLKMFCEWLEGLGAVDDGLADSVQIPKLDADARSNDSKLHARDALPLLMQFRNGPQRGSRLHAIFELAWVTGARVGGIRGLDVRDLHTGSNPYLAFRHRPGTDTPLKNKILGERPVEIPQETADVLSEYVHGDRHDVRDDHGRQPLLASTRGRPSTNTLRVWSYLAVQPCLFFDCPHGRGRESCEFTDYTHASKCPSSRSPHRIRTGAITHLLNIGWPPEDVAERVNSSIGTIEQHYDKAAPEERFRRLRERMESRRRSLINDLDPTDSSHDFDQ